MWRNTHGHYTTILIPYLVLRSPIGRLAGPFGLANYVEDFKVYIFAV